MNAPLDESTKRTLEAAARLLELGEKPAAVMEFVFGLGYMEGLLKMASSQAARVDSYAAKVDSAMRQIL